MLTWTIWGQRLGMALFSSPHLLLRCERPSCCLPAVFLAGLLEQRKKYISHSRLRQKATASQGEPEKNIDRIDKIERIL